MILALEVGINPILGHAILLWFQFRFMYRKKVFISLSERRFFLLGLALYLSVLGHLFFVLPSMLLWILGLEIGAYWTQKYSMQYPWRVFYLFLVIFYVWAGAFLKVYVQIFPIPFLSFLNFLYYGLLYPLLFLYYHKQWRFIHSI